MTHGTASSSQQQPPLRDASATKQRNTTGSAQTGDKCSSNALPSSLATPTAASAARSVNAPQPPTTPFGSSEPRLPSHMKERGSQGPSVDEEVDASDQPPQQNALFILEHPGGTLPGSPSVERADLAAHKAYGTPAHNSSSTARSQNSALLSFCERGNVWSYRNPSPVSVRSLAAWEGTSLWRERVPLSTESVTAALSQYQIEAEGAEHHEEAAPFFSGFGCSIDLFNESLSAAVECDHVPYNPHSPSDEDLLLFYGVHQGEVLGFDHASTLALRDVAIRYQHQHRAFVWEHLSDLIQSAVQIDASSFSVVPTVNPETTEHCFSLNLLQLSAMAHAVVAVQQILEALHAFLGRDPATSFSIDPRYRFLYMLEACPSRTELRFVFSSLQMRLGRLDQHIHTYLKGIRETLIGTSETLSESLASVESTISDVRREFGTQPPQKELYRLIAHPDYGRRVALIDPLAHQGYLRVLGKTLRERYYKPRDHSAIPTI
ncbi:hypothetical protein B0H19DRAFT_1266213 [Mycena capillaripes]|nr:hypothetical protein B0H19DRAFT_1266213 [Mycena capillaripes]